MRQAMLIFDDLRHYERMNGRTTNIENHDIVVSISTGMTDMDRYQATRSSIERCMGNKPFERVVKFFIVFSVRDTASGRTSRAKATCYAVNKQYKEKAKVYNVDRQSINSVKEILKPIIRKTASEVSMEDALKMMGFDEEDRGQFLNEYGEYKRPDLATKWNHLFSGGESK